MRVACWRYGRSYRSNTLAGDTRIWLHMDAAMKGALKERCEDTAAYAGADYPRMYSLRHYRHILGGNEAFTAISSAEMKHLPPYPGRK